VALRRFRAAMDASSDAIYLIDRATMRYIDVNETACRMTGRTREEILALGPTGVLGQNVADLEKVFDSVIAGGAATEPLELLRPRKDGAQAWVELTRRAQHTGEGWVIISVVRDITERKKLEEAPSAAGQLRQPHRAAQPDAPLRQAAPGPDPGQEEVRCTRASSSSTSTTSRRSTITHGHGAGDELLKQSRSASRSAFAPATRSAGWAGTSSSWCSGNRRSEGRGLIARKAIDSLARPFDLGGHEVSISASIGVASYPDDGDSVDELIATPTRRCSARRRPGATPAGSIRRRKRGLTPECTGTGTQIDRTAAPATDFQELKLEIYDTSGLHDSIAAPVPVARRSSGTATRTPRSRRRR